MSKKARFRHGLLVSGITAFALFAASINQLSAQTTIFSDDFSNPTGWTFWGGGGAFLPGEVSTYGASGSAGGVYRTLSIVLPATISFDFRTLNVHDDFNPGLPYNDAGWFIGINSVNGYYAGATAQVQFIQDSGSRNIIRVANGIATAEPGQAEPITGWYDYTSTYSHVVVAVNADLSATVTITYYNGTQVTTSFSVAPGGPIGPFFVLGNSNRSYGPHMFANLLIQTPAPKYKVCLLYDPTKAVHSGASIPIKLQLCDSTGNDLSSSSIAVHAVSITQTSISISGPVQDSGNANPDNDFRFDSGLGSTGGYIFNLKTTGLTTGTYNLNFTVTGDSFIYAVPFQVK